MADAARDHRRARGDPRRRDACCAPSSRTSWPRSRRSSPTSGARKITFDAGDMNIEDLIDDEELVVTLSAKGYIKTVPADTFRAQGRGGRGVAGAKLRDEDYVTPHPHHHRARVPAVLLEPRARLPAQGARDPEEGAHRPRHRDRSTCCSCSRASTSRRSSTRATTRRTASCSSPRRRARSRRRSSTSTTRRCAPASSPSTCATATSS